MNHVIHVHYSNNFHVSALKVSIFSLSGLATRLNQAMGHHEVMRKKERLDHAGSLNCFI